MDKLFYEAPQVQVIEMGVQAFLMYRKHNKLTSY